MIYIQTIRSKLFLLCSGQQTYLLCKLFIHLSMMLSLQLYKLSNFVFVTESLTFMAGTVNLPAFDSWYKRCTPVTLSSTIPFTNLKMAGYFFSIKCVASPPSSNIIFGCQFSAFTHLSMHHQKSSSVSPRHAKIGKPASAKAAATSFWKRNSVESIYVYSNWTQIHVRRTCVE